MTGTENLTSPAPTEPTKKKKYSVLGQHIGGGPHGIGKLIYNLDYH